MLKTVITILLLIALFFVVVMVIDNHRFVVRRYVVRSPLIRYPVRTVFIADLHEKDYGSDNEKLVEEIRREKPDAILIGGDLIVSGEVGRHYRRTLKDAGSDAEREPGTDWMKNTLSLMKKLTQICPVWFVRGNHEIRLDYYEELRDYDKVFVEQMEKAGVFMLGNGCADPAAKSHEERESGIRLQGLELPGRYYKKFAKTVLTEEEIERIIGKADPSLFTVLLTHTPVYFEPYAEWGADLCLCGHVHGGLMRLPLIGGVMGTSPNLFPKYSGGRYRYRSSREGKERESTLVLTCGLGTHTLPIRIFNPGEISVIEFEPENTGEQKQALSGGDHGLT